MFSFDRCTGMFSNTLSIENELQPGSHFPFYSGCALSANDSVLYVLSNQDPYHTSSFLFQYDITSPNIAASKLLIDSLPVDASPFGIDLAPDGKIYISAAYIGPGTNYPYPDSVRNYINENLSVINYPNNLGTSCDFQQFSFYLGGRRTYFGLPNNPNYELGRWVGSPCDSLTPVYIPKPEQSFFQAWYNQEWQMAHINASDVKGENATIQIFNLSGQLITQQNREIVNGYFTASVPLPGIAKGVYIAELVNEMGKLSTKFVVK